MLNFTFKLPTLALFGEGQIQAIREHIPQDVSAQNYSHKLAFLFA
ncbi:hypothetical protein [Pasteurella multocida]